MATARSAGERDKTRPDEKDRREEHDNEGDKEGDKEDDKEDEKEGIEHRAEGCEDAENSFEK